jgi:hypothetical protein
MTSWRFPGWPAARDPLRIAALADLRLGSRSTASPISIARSR